MKNTVMPTSKGQITIPVDLRKKYSIDQNTSVRFIDRGDGVIELKILRLQEAVFGQMDSREGWDSLTFSQPVSPRQLIDAINKIDGSD
jgi:bifunctional DNA-binding transcriptional regulator/antitoxin component of YhaV-PrlF toxin-antitoxin module